ncbi:hypothetical protein EVAR_73597_1 [Eumeta japonica]|uniref:Uncharacterized protein n=1 Tax=Eumeta variegata TaxID=151549 RepID=A0A4C1SB43_EUMVA|nr:hypothetical protein EVAR_73597_1 [Eumeta japonica]
MQCILFAFHRFTYIVQIEKPSTQPSNKRRGGAGESVCGAGRRGRRRAKLCRPIIRSRQLKLCYRRSKHSATLALRGQASAHKNSLSGLIGAKQIKGYVNRAAKFRWGRSERKPCDLYLVTGGGCARPAAATRRPRRALAQRPRHGAPGLRQSNKTAPYVSKAICEIIK